MRPAGPGKGRARIVEALLGVAAIVVVFLLGGRLAGRPPACSPPSPSAIYPPFIHSTGELMSEPPAFFTLPAAVLAFLWAGEREGLRAWLLPGLLFGMTALIRPEYLVVGIAFAVLAAIRVGRERGWRPGLGGAALLAAALLVPIVPWTIRNEIVLGRLVPISTGDGKALYVGTYLPADGEYQKVKALLVRRYLHRDLGPFSPALEKVDPTPLFNRVAARYPELPRDTALGKIAKQDFSHYFGTDPIGYLAMTARKAGGSGAAASAKRWTAPPVAPSRSCSCCSGWWALGSSPRAGAGGSCRRWRPRSCLSPPSERSRWPLHAGTRS